jgi:hypothetical protein
LFFNVFTQPLSFYPDAEFEGVGFTWACGGVSRSALLLFAEAICRSRFLSARWTRSNFIRYSPSSIILLPLIFIFPSPRHLVCIILFIFGLEHVYVDTKRGFSISNMRNSSDHGGCILQKVILHSHVALNNYSRAGVFSRYQQTLYRDVAKERKTYFSPAVLLQWGYVHYMKLNSIL